MTPALLTGCLVSPESAPRLEAEWSGPALEGEHFTSLKIHDGVLYAGTQSELFRRELDGDDGWEALGLQELIDGRGIRGFLVLGSSEILAGVGSFGEYRHDTTPLYRSTDGGASWAPYQNGFGEKEGDYNAIGPMDAAPSGDVLFARAGGAVARSEDRGQSWETVYGTWTYPQTYAFFMHVDQQNPDKVWAGGGTNIFTPDLLRSTDGGESWSQLNPLEGSEADAHDIIIHPENSDHVLVGVSAIRRSRDGGETWETVFGEADIRAFAHGSRQPGSVYASGRNARGTLFFAISNDFGERWEIVEYEESPTGIWAEALVAAERGGREVLFLGTNQGVYSYAFGE